MLGSAVLIFEDDHIKITLFEDTFPALQRPLQLIQRILILIYTSFMAYLAIDCLGLAAAAASSPAMKIPMILVYIVYPLFAVAAFIHAVWHLVLWMKPSCGTDTPEKHGEEESS